MGIANIINNSTTTSGGEIVRELVNSSDGAGLHFDGAAGNIDIASPPDLGTKFSFEYVIKADSFGSAYSIITDFGTSGRFQFGSFSANSYNLGIYDTGDRNFGVKVLDDLKVHHLVLTVDGTSAKLYDNGNEVATATVGSPTIDSCTDAKIGKDVGAASGFFNGTIYRCRFWNKTLEPDEVRTAFERADVDFADQYGDAANVITTAAWKNWGTNQADTGNDTNDRATFNSNYGTSGPTLGWGISGTPINISVASNVLTFSATSDGQGIHYALPAGTLVAGKKYRLTIATGAITGSAKARLYSSAGYVDVSLAASKTNFCDFTAPAGAIQYFYIHLFGGTGASPASIQLNAASVSNNFVQTGCVSDYDLAFANPTQSRMVQDRSGAADGTTSASGVSQVQPVVQLNAAAARIGTTQATPADNQLIVGAGSGSAQADADDIILTNGSSVNAGITFNTPSAGGYLYFADGNENDDLYRGFIKYVHSGNAMEFGTNAVSRLAISSTGAVDISGPASHATALTVGNSTGGTELQVIPKENESITLNSTEGSTAHALILATGGTPRLTVASTGLATFANGIALQTSPTNPDATAGEAYTLDKYETGTWTPVYAPSSGTFATMDMDVLSAKYTRIGNTVLVQATIRTDDVDITGGSGVLRINGLPFPVAGSGAYGTVYIGEAGSFASSKFPCAGYCTVSASHITLTKLSGVAGSILGAGVDSLTTGTTANQNSLIFAAQYTA